MTSGTGIRLMEGHHTTPTVGIRKPRRDQRTKPLIMLRKLTGYSNGSLPHDNNNYILVVKSDCYSER